MATTVKAQTPGKSAFLKEFFVDHPDAGKAAINDAWRQAGNDGEISTSLASQVRRRLKATDKPAAKTKTKRKRAATRKRPTDTAKAAVATTRKAAKTVVKRAAKRRADYAERTRALLRLEETFDDLLQEVVQLGGLPEVVDAVRIARRKLIQAQAE